TIGTLPASAADNTETLTLVAEIALSGSYTNSASIIAAEFDPDLTNNSHAVTLVPEQLIANDDTYSGVSGAPTPLGNVLSNDVFDGTYPAQIDDVTITVVSPATPIGSK